MENGQRDTHLDELGQVSLRDGEVLIVEDEGGVGARQSVLVELRETRARAPVSAHSRRDTPAGREGYDHCAHGSWHGAAACNERFSSVAEPTPPSTTTAVPRAACLMLALGRLGPRKCGFFAGNRRRVTRWTPRRVRGICARAARRAVLTARGII